MVNSLIALSRRRHHRTIASGGGGTIPGALVEMDAEGIIGAAIVTEFQNNKGSGGAAYDFDVIGGTAANLRRSLSGTVTFYPGTGHMTTPDSAVLDTITGSFEIRLRLTPDLIIPATNQSLLSRWDGIAGDISYAFQLNTSGRLIIAISTDGVSAAFTATASTGLPTANGQTVWLRVTYDVDADDVIFYTSTDDTNDPAVAVFVQLGTIQSVLDIASVHAGSVGLEIGRDNIGDITGSVHRGVLYDDINGTVIADMNPTDYVRGLDFTSSTTSEVWTLISDVFIQNTGHDVVHSIGSASMESTAEQTIGAPFVMYMVMRASDPAPITQLFIDSKTTVGLRAGLASDSAQADRFSIYEGSAFIDIAQPYDNNMHVIAGEFNTDATTKITVADLGDATGDAGSNDLGYSTLFANNGGTETFKGYIATLLIYTGTHTPAEVAQNIAALEAQYNVISHKATLVRLPGGSGNYISTPDSAAVSVTSDIDLRWFGSLDDWTPSPAATFIAKWLNSGNQRSFTFRQETGLARVSLTVSSNGQSATEVTVTSTVSTGFVNGTEHGMRVTWNNGSNVVQFFTRDDNNIDSDSGWTQLGANVTLSSTGIFDGTALLEIGSRQTGAGDVMVGKVKRAIMKNGINGTTVADFNATDGVIGGSSLISSTTGESWSINGNASLQDS